jgi:serine/threonine protein kinase
MSPSLPMVGEEFAGYRLRGVLGRGGMSVVFEAENPRLGSVVALKVLAPELAADDLFRARFLQESRIAASLNHPHVIPIFDTGPCDGLLYIAMRYVAGRDLRAVLRERERIPPEQALMLIAQAGRALDAAHRRGLVHRDVKPANILIERVAEDEPEHVYLADFGITKQGRSQSGLTATGQFVGTIDYIAPEQVQGKSVDGRADIYSLGCVLYECITGRVPFQKDLDAAVIWAHVEEMPTAPTAIRSELPPEIDQVIARVLAKDPDDRYSTAHEFMDAARAALGIASQASGARSFEENIPLVSPTVMSDATAPPSAPPPRPPEPVSGTPPEFGEPQGAPPTVMPPAAVSLPASTSPPQQPPAEPPPAELPPQQPPATPPPAAPPPLAAAAAVGGSATAGEPPSGGPPSSGRQLPGERPSRSWRPLAAVALLAAIVAGVVVVLASSGGGKSSGATSTPRVAQGEATAAKLAAVPTNHVNGSGTATVALNGNIATVTVNAQGLLEGAPHLMHIHAGGLGTCPPASAARLHNGHLAISTEDGIKYYGPPEASLTTRGDTSAASYLVFARFPSSGDIIYKRQMSVSSHLAAKIRAGNAVVVIHGIDYDGSGVYDNVLSHSELLPTVPADATAPALCGPLVAQASAQAGSAGGGVYVAALGTEPDYLAWWCEPPAAGTTEGSDARLDAAGTGEDA